MLHDALYPGLRQRLRARWRRLREPWGDDLLARLRHHARAVVRLRPREAQRYAAARAAALAAGWSSVAEPTRRGLRDRERAYTRLALTARPRRWEHPAILVLTPERPASLYGAWRRVLPRLSLTQTGPDAEGDTAARLRELLALSPRA
jgi:hypothetical protein